MLFVPARPWHTTVDLIATGDVVALQQFILRKVFPA